MIDQVSEFRLWVGCCHRFPKTLTTEGTRTVLLPAHCLVHLMRSQNWPIPEAVRPSMQYIIDVLLNVAKASTPSSDHSKITTVKPCLTKQNGQLVIVPVLLSTINSINHLRLVVPKYLRQDIAQEHLWTSVLEVESRFFVLCCWIPIYGQ